MGFLTREQILSAQGRRYGEVDLPELGGKVRVASLPAAKLFAYQKLQRRREAGEDVEQEMTLLLLSGGCVDENGAPLFDRESATALLEVLSVEAMTKLVSAISALTNPKKDDEGAVEGNA